MARIEIKTTEYEFAHGRKPRGTGMWGFRRPGSDEIVWKTGTYTAAKAQLDAGTWIVCS